MDTSSPQLRVRGPDSGPGGVVQQPFFPDFLAPFFMRPITPSPATRPALARAQATAAAGAAVSAQGHVAHGFGSMW